ncbi:MAG: hypothetical protein GY847_02575 [Proteobacteria bacterium]|nr:hypothetical protein [Pseudomonadota bacterium]
MIPKEHINVVLDVDGTCVPEAPVELRSSGRVSDERAYLKKSWLSDDPVLSARRAVEQLLRLHVNVHFSTGNDWNRLQEGLVNPWRADLELRGEIGLLTGVSFYCNGSTSRVVFDGATGPLTGDSKYSEHFRLSDAVVKLMDQWTVALNMPGLRTERRFGLDGNLGQCTVKPFGPSVDRVMLARSLKDQLVEIGVTDCNVISAGRTSIDVVRNADKSHPISHIAADVPLARIISVGNEVYERRGDDGSIIHTGNDFPPVRVPGTLIVAVNDSAQNPIQGVPEDRYINPGTGPAGTSALLAAIIRAVTGTSFPNPNIPWEETLAWFLHNQ